MASNNTADFDKLISELEYDIKQYLKEIQKERQSIHYIEEYTEKIQQELEAEQKMTPYLDQSVKSYHKLFTINRDMIDSIKRALESAKVEAENLNHQLEQMMEDNEKEHKDHEIVLQHYLQKWEDYKESYEELPLAKRLAESLKLKEEFVLKNKEMFAEIDCLKQEKQMLEKDFKPSTDWVEFVVKLAPLRLEALKLEKQATELEEKCQTLQENIKLKREQTKTSQQEENEMRRMINTEKKEVVKGVSKEYEQTRNSLDQQREEHQNYGVVPEQLQNTQGHLLIEQQQQHKQQQQQQYQRTKEEQQRMEQKENTFLQEMQINEPEKQITQQDQQNLQQDELMMEQDQTAKEQDNQNKIPDNMQQDTRGIKRIQSVELNAASHLEIPKLRFPQIKTTSIQSFAPAAIQIPSIQLAIPRVSQQTSSHSREKQTPRIPQIMKLPQSAKLPETSPANVLPPKKYSIMKDIPQGRSLSHVSQEGLAQSHNKAAASAAMVTVSGISSTSSGGKIQGDGMTQDDVVTPGREQVKSCSVLEKTLPSVCEMKTLPQTNDTDISDIESQLKKIKMLAKQSPGFTYGPRQAMHENKTGAEDMKKPSNSSVFDFSGEQFFQPLFRQSGGAAQSSNAVEENSSTTAFNFNESHDPGDSDELADTHACILTLFGDKETDNRTNTNDQSEQSFFNFGDASTDDLPEFRSSTFSLF